MTLNEWIRVQNMISWLAKREGCSPAEIRSEIQKSIDAAWDNSRDDTEVKARWAQLFPAGKPTLEQFVVRIADHLSQEDQCSPH